jgi:hypothetical protein
VLDARYVRLLNQKKPILSKMITDALCEHAADQLEILREANPVTKDTKDAAWNIVTVRVEEMHDGVGIMQEFLTWLNRDQYDDESDFHVNCLLQMHEHPLPEGCTEAQLTARVAHLTAKLNPYLGKFALQGAELSRFIINQMPFSLAQFKAAKLAAIKEDAALAADYQKVLRQCCETIRLTRDHSAPPPVLGVFGVNGVPYTPSPTQKKVKLALTAQERESKKGERNERGKGVVRDVRKRFARNKLPPGEKCASGTCEYKHGGVCWRNPREKVTLPTNMSDKVKEVIKAERAALRMPAMCRGHAHRGRSSAAHEWVCCASNDATTRYIRRQR